jgi:hypothetical protein
MIELDFAKSVIELVAAVLALCAVAIPLLKKRSDDVAFLRHRELAQ